jgi:hypothetical protein
MDNNASGGSRIAGGDRVYLSSDHSETYSSSGVNLNLGSPGGFTGIVVVSVNRAGSVPPVAADVTSGAAITVSANGSQLIINPNTDIYYQGVTFTNSGTGSAQITLGNSNHNIYLKNCALVLSGNTASGQINTGACTQATLDNTTMQFAHTSQTFNSGNTIDFIWLNTPSGAVVSGTIPTLLLTPSGSAGNLFTARGVDLSNLNTTLTNGTNSSFWKVLLDSCKISASMNAHGSTWNGSADEVELVNCDNGTHFVSERHTPAGDLTTEFSVTLSGGAADNVGNYSHKMVSSSRADKFILTLNSFWMDVNNTSTGSSKTATVEIASSGSLNNDDISLWLEYEGTSSSSLASGANSFIATPVTSNAAVTSSSATWNSSPGTTQKLQVTFTPQTAGRVRGQVRLGKASTTVYINPQITIS